MLTIQQDDYETELAERFDKALHAQCTGIKRRRLECIWAPSGYCFNCGRPIPTFREGAPGEIK